MRRQQIPLGRVFGIPIGLDYSWFLIFALITWALAVSYYPAEFPAWSPASYWVMGAVTAVALFGSVLLHELGHSLVAMQFRIPVRSITLFVFGGVAQITTEPQSAFVEFLVALAGPIVSFLLAAAFEGLKIVVGGAGPLFGLLEYLAFINFALALFNLIPGFPLDGGRIFRAIVWAVTHDMRRATIVAGMVGRAFGFLLILLGVWYLFEGQLVNGLWIAFIGWFLDNAASAQVRSQKVQSQLAGHTVGQVMSRHVPTVAGDTTLQQLVDERVIGAGMRAFVVTDERGNAGLMTLNAIKGVPREAWGTTTAGEIMLPLDQVRAVSPESLVWSALQDMDRQGVNELPVVQDGAVIGMLGRQDVASLLRTLKELGA